MTIRLDMMKFRFFLTGWIHGVFGYGRCVAGGREGSLARGICGVGKDKCFNGGYTRVNLLIKSVAGYEPNVSSEIEASEVLTKFEILGS